MTMIACSIWRRDAHWYLTGSRFFFVHWSKNDKDVHRLVRQSVPDQREPCLGVFRRDPSFWWEQSTITLVIERVDDDQVVGGLTALTNTSRRTRRQYSFHMAPALPEADVLRADALRIVIPWLRDEHEYMVVRLNVAADEHETVAAAEEFGYEVRGTSARIRCPPRRLERIAFVTRLSIHAGRCRVHNPILIGERVYIRPFEESDAQLLSEIYAAETETFMNRGRMPTGPLAWKKMDRRDPQETTAQ